ncbi:major facilitator superfamily domain-containing protein [Xylaria telfairii]|nr:major facilitator superfamily domain-containing protein [Xylaria telfairii]
MSLSVLAKIDLYLLPLLLIASFLAALDKNSLAYAAVLGMSDDLHLHGQQYSWLGSIFYFGYLLMEIPTVWLLTRVPIGKYLGVLLILWGACLSFSAACTNFASAVIIRFFLGMTEAGLLPTCIIFTATWYRREEQPLRVALWYGPFSGVLGGVLAYAIGDIRAQIPVWKILFLIYGTTTIAIGLLCVVWLPDDYDSAYFLSRAEREVAKLRTRDNLTGETVRQKANTAQITEALRDPKYWIVLVFGIFQSVTNAGITNFSPVILSGLGYSKRVTVLLAAPQGAVALVAQVSATLLTLKLNNIRCLLWVLSCIPALIGVVIIQRFKISQGGFAGLAGLYLTGFYNVSWVIAMSLVSSNTAGGTKKSFVSVSMAVSYGEHLARAYAAPTAALLQRWLLTLFSPSCGEYYRTTTLLGHTKTAIRAWNRCDDLFLHDNDVLRCLVLARLQASE